MKRSLNLSSLKDFVCQFLISTEDTKNILQSECEEARFVLKPWLIETNVMKEINDSCTCDNVLSAEAQIEQIVSGIDRTVLQAQQLREKLAINVAKEKKRSRAPDLQNIYMPEVVLPVERPTKKVPSLKKGIVIQQPIKSNSEKENGCKNYNLNSSDNGSNEKTSKNAQQFGGATRKLLCSKTMNSTNDGICSKRTSLPRNRRSTGSLSSNCFVTDSKEKEDNLKLKSKAALIKPLKELPSAVHKDIARVNKCVRSKSVLDNKLLKPSSCNTLVTKSSTKSKPQKNFVLANIKSIKRKDSAQPFKPTVHSKSQASNMLVKESNSFSSINEKKSLISDYKASTTELNELISKMTLESVENSSESYSKEKINNCPFHGSTGTNFIEKRITTTVDIVEGLDRLGVPSELIKTLKIYHTYVKQELSGESPLHGKGQKAINKFLSEFEAMNDGRQNQLEVEKLSNLTISFISLFKESHSENMDFIHLSKLKIKYTDLDSAYKLYNVKNINATKIERSTIGESMSQDCLQNWRGWRSNGIWNDASIMSFEGMSRVLCIRYANKNQLLSLMETIQQLQRTQYLNNLINLLISMVIPEVQRILDPTSKEYVEAYKMIYIISQGLNPMIPVLVRSDK